MIANHISLRWRIMKKRMCQLWLFMLIFIVSACNQRPVTTMNPTVTSENSNMSINDASIEGEKDTSSIDNIESIKQIEQLLSELYPNDPEKVIQGTLAFLRKNKYGYASPQMVKLVWTSYAGGLENEIGYVHEEHENLTSEIEEIVDGLRGFKEPNMRETIDFIHLIAVVDIIVTKNTDDNLEERYLDFLFTWGGDLETLMEDTAKYSVENAVLTEAELKDFAEKSMLRPVSDLNETSFMLDDFLADIDGCNIGQIILNENLLVSDAIEYYYNDRVLKRYELFVSEFGGEEGFIEAVSIISMGVDESDLSEDMDAEFYKMLLTLRGLIASFGNHYDIDVDEDIRNIVAEGFVDVVLREMNKDEY